MSQSVPLDTSIAAEYADGFILDETALGDTSPYTGIHNIFNDVLKKRPEAEHGTMVRFSVFYHNNRYDIDWTTVPENARPIRFRDMEQDSVGGQIIETRTVGCHMGYQFTDENGKNQQFIKELE